MHTPPDTNDTDSSSTAAAQMTVADIVRVATALAVDDIDAALQAGLLCIDRNDTALQACVSPAQWQCIVKAQTARQQALAARARFESRNARLAKRAAERAARRAIPTTAALPSAAAAALARAKARANGR